MSFGSASIGDSRDPLHPAQGINILELRARLKRALSDFEIVSMEPKNQTCTRYPLANAPSLKNYCLYDKRQNRLFHTKQSPQMLKEAQKQFEKKPELIELDARAWDELQTSVTDSKKTQESSTGSHKSMPSEPYQDSLSELFAEFEEEERENDLRYLRKLLQEIADNELKHLQNMVQERKELLEHMSQELQKKLKKASQVERHDIQTQIKDVQNALQVEQKNEELVHTELTRRGKSR